MSKQWKLIHEEHVLMIENYGGKTLGYNPNSGIGILEQDGYAFKDLNGNGSLEIFEDWRRPMEDRVEDFMKQYGLIQKDGVLYYKRGLLKIPQEMMLDVTDEILRNEIHPILQEEHVKEQYLKDHYLFVMLLLMFDHDDGSRIQDYTIKTFIQGIEHGLLDHLIYSIAKGMKQFAAQHSQRALQSFA